MVTRKRRGKAIDSMHARYYSPYLARFLSVDPVGGKVGSSQSWNRYSYVMNNPINATDPTGQYTDYQVEQWGKPRPPMVGDSTPEQRAITNGVFGGAGVVFAVLTAYTVAPAAIAADILIGGGLGLTTSGTQAAFSDAPADQKVKSMLVGTLVGAGTGPIKVTDNSQALTAVASRLASDQVLSSEFPTAGEATKEAGKGYLAGTVAVLIPGGGAIKSLASSTAKLVLDFLDQELTRDVPDEEEAK